MPVRNKLVGLKIGHLLVVSAFGRMSGGRYRYVAECVCVCGKSIHGKVVSISMPSVQSNGKSMQIRSCITPNSTWLTGVANGLTRDAEGNMVKPNGTASSNR